MCEPKIEYDQWGSPKPESHIRVLEWELAKRDHVIECAIALIEERDVRQLKWKDEDLKKALQPFMPDTQTIGD